MAKALTPTEAYQKIIDMNNASPFSSKKKVGVTFDHIPAGKESESVTERTFIMIKPDAFQRGLVGEILDLVSQRGLKLIALKTIQLSPTDCEKHYSHHVGKSFYPQLVEFMTSGPSMAIILEGNQACPLIRQLIGNSKHPSQVQPGSIRGRYAMDFPRNLIHGSDTFEDAKRESRIYLDNVEIFDDSNVFSLREEFARQHEAHIKEVERKIKEGIHLGDETFTPSVLKVGDWIYSQNGMSRITAMGSDPKNKGYLYIDHEDYFGYAWGESNRYLYGKDQSFESSLEFSWTGQAMYLVGRDDKYLVGFKTTVMNYYAKKNYTFKEGKWLPLFSKKVKKNTLKLKVNPWAKTISYGGGIRITDVYDPKNLNVMRITAEVKSLSKWQIILGNGERVDINKFFNTTQARNELIAQSTFNSPVGSLSVLLHMGKPYSTTYGDGITNDLIYE